jgi:hypothetical protein
MKLRRILRSYYHVFFVLTVSARIVSGALPFGIQSDDGDVTSTFASSMVYDPVIERLYITGSSYGGFFDSQYSHRTKLGNRDCFLASLQLPTSTDARGPVWLLRESYGKTNVSEACTDLQLYRRNNVRAYYLAVHSVGSAGILDVLQNNSTNNISTANTIDENERTFGMILDTSVTGQLDGGFLVREDAAQMPLSITSVLDDTGDVIIVSIYSNQSFVDSQYSTWMDKQNTLQPDPDIRCALLSSAEEFTYATSLRRMAPVRPKTQTQDTIQRTLKPLWENRFASDNTSLFIVSSVLVLSNGVLLVSGYQSVQSISTTTTTSFVKQVNAQTGEELNSTSLQIRRNSSNDRAFALCGNSGSRYAYVAGSYDVSDAKNISNLTESASAGSTRSFLLKLDINDMSTVWKKEFQAFAASATQQSASNVYGLGCVADLNDDYVYLAGTVQDGAIISLDGVTNSTSSSGGDDIYAVKLNSAEGEIIWLSQVGTLMDDSLATGRNIVLDKLGNVILLGNTRGSFMREKKQTGLGITNDVVIFSIDKDSGSHLPIFDAPSVQTPQLAEENGNKSNSSFISTSTQIHNGTLWNEVHQLRPSANVENRTYPTVPPARPSAQRNSSKGVLLVAIILVANIMLASFGGLICIRRKMRINVISFDNPKDQMLLHLAHYTKENLSGSMDMEAESFTSADYTLKIQRENKQADRKPTLTGSRSEESTEREVMRLLQEWKRQRGHPMDPSGVYT